MATRLAYPAFTLVQQTPVTEHLGLAPSIPRLACHGKRRFKVYPGFSYFPECEKGAASHPFHTRPSRKSKPGRGECKRSKLDTGADRTA